MAGESKEQPITPEQASPDFYKAAGQQIEIKPRGTSVERDWSTQQERQALGDQVKSNVIHAETRFGKPEPVVNEPENLLSEKAQVFMTEINNISPTDRDAQIKMLNQIMAASELSYNEIAELTEKLHEKKAA